MEAKKVAYGALSLKPDEFFALTPGDYYDLVEGYRWRREQAARDRAEIGWYVARFEREQKLKPFDKYFGSTTGKSDKPIEEARADYEELKKSRLGRLA